MSRLGRLLLTSVIACAATLLAPPPTASSVDDTEAITRYATNLTLQASGDLVVVETLIWRFDRPRYGIFRTFIRGRDPQRPLLPDPRSLRVTRDGVVEPARVLGTEEGLEVQIGNPDELVSGVRVYQIRYTVPGAITEQDRNDLSWILIGNGWKLPILSSRHVVRFPAPTIDGRCTVGDRYQDCAGIGTDTLTYRTGELEPGTAFSIRAEYGLVAFLLSSVGQASWVDRLVAPLIRELGAQDPRGAAA